MTLHGFLGNHYGPSVRHVASYLTIVGFLGFAVAETYFGSKVLLSIVQNKALFYTLIALALFFVFGYIAYGGQLSSIRTDQLQLIVAYTGVFGIMLYFLYVIITHGLVIGALLKTSLIILAIYIPFVLAVRRFQFIRFSEEDTPAGNIINKLLNLTIGLLLVLLFVGVVFQAFKAIHTSTADHFFNLEGFGTFGLLSLIILPLLWQFVDLTNWQRILAVKADRQDDTASLHRNIRKGLIIYAIESPFTWVIFLFFGLLAVSALPHFTFTDLLVDIPKQLINGSNVFKQLIGYTFIVSVIAIMLSTIDSFIVGMIFTFVYDSFPKTRRVLDSGDQTAIARESGAIINSGRVFGAIAILIGISAFILFDQHISNGGEMFINLLLAFYSAQLAFFPLIAGILFGSRRVTPQWANTSMISGATVGILLGIYSVIWNPAYAWYPILACVAVSGIVFILGYATSRDDTV